MKRKKIKAIKQNKEIIRAYKQEISIEHFAGLEKVKLTCIKCQTVYHILAHHPELYTEKVRENYICLTCR